MTPLILSIFCSSLIFVIFKLFSHFKINTFQAIVANYITASTLGIVLYGNEWNPVSLEENRWMGFALIAAILFISLFFVMGRSSQTNGVASTSVAVKMSMAVSLLFMIYWYRESLSGLKIVGILLAFLGVYLVSSKGKHAQKTNASWMLFFLFFGSGLLDFLLNYVQKNELETMTPSLFSAIGLGGAGIIGLLILLFKMAKGTEKLEWKNALAGIILGVPNYFSIYLLLRSYQTTGWKDSTVLAITNVSIVLISAVVGFIAFRENANKKKLIGLFSAILAIVTLYIAN